MAGARGLNLGAIEFFSLFILFLSIRRISSTEQKSCPEPGRRRRFSHINLEGIFCGRAEGLFVAGWSTARLIDPYIDIIFFLGNVGACAGLISWVVMSPLQCDMIVRGITLFFNAELARTIASSRLV
jgi:hypothetical protein